MPYQIDRMSDDLKVLEKEIRACTRCAPDMQRKPNPIFQVGSQARILLAGQAPGNLADTLGRPFMDPSGVRLRAWLGVDEAQFYDPAQFAIVPMGFCFPGYDAKGGDLPPIKRCAEVWRETLLAQLPNIELTLLIGSYAQAWHLRGRREKTLTATVAKWTEFMDEGVVPLPHPSWRNNTWLKRNPWFEIDLLPQLQRRVQRLLF